jgi:hypothetical protein
MTPVASEKGFTLVELLIASLVTLTIMSIAVGTFTNALDLKEAAMQVADASQNLRAGSNLLVRDLLQVGRDMPRGGIAIPSGTGATAIHRPGPANESYTFDDDSVVLTAITTGAAMGAEINNRETDLITLLTVDPYLPALSLSPPSAAGNVAKYAANGGSFTVGADTLWITGDAENGIAPVKAGDLVYFQASENTLQTVTQVTSTTVTFGPSDPFNLNQPGAESGSITQVLSGIGSTPVTARRVFMYTYFVYEDTPGVPRLMRQLNFFPPQALAGVIEDLDLSYDLFDGTNNPVEVKSLPHTANDVTYTENQIRKVRIHIGVRSEFKSPKANDYLRNHVSTVISLRNLAFVSRYDTE